MTSSLDIPTVSAMALGRLRWRCRRGLLENDLFIERFFAEHGNRLNMDQLTGLESLMELDDPQLLDLLLQRRPLDASRDRKEVREVLALLQRPARARPDAGTFETTATR